MITVQLLGGASLRSGNTPLAWSASAASPHCAVDAHRRCVAAAAFTRSCNGAACGPSAIWRMRADCSTSRCTCCARRLGEGAIASAGDGLLLNPSLVSCDLHAMRAAIAADTPDRIVRLYAGPLLDGFHLDDSNEFMYWLDERRSELSHAYVGALLTIAERQKRSGDVHDRVGTCRKLVAMDPHSAVYAQALMRALEAAGDRAAAIQHASRACAASAVWISSSSRMPDVVALGGAARAGPREAGPGAHTSRRNPLVRGGGACRFSA